MIRASLIYYPGESVPRIGGRSIGYISTTVTTKTGLVGGPITDIFDFHNTVHFYYSEFFYHLNTALGRMAFRYGYSQGGTWDDITNQRIAGLHGNVQRPATDFINQVESELGIKLRLTESMRTNAEQNDLYAQGRTQPGQIVTNARGGESYHNYGLALDVVEIRNGQAIWNTNWQGISEIGIRNGFEWGGNWTTPDRPHFQMTFGLSIGDLQGGAGP